MLLNTFRLKLEVVLLQSIEDQIQLLDTFDVHTQTII